MSRAVCLIDYASPDLIPADLRPVALVSAPTGDCQLCAVTTVVARADALPDQALWGSVTYATTDLVPVFLQKVGNG